MAMGRHNVSFDEQSENHGAFHSREGGIDELQEIVHANNDAFLTRGDNMERKTRGSCNKGKAHWL